MMRILLALMLLSCPSIWAQKKTVFLITDAEGVGGVCRQEQTDPKDTEMRQLLTGEINAAVEGFLAGGADEVLVWDGHDGSQTLSTLTIHPKAKLLMGGLGPSMLMERKFSAVAYVGQHSKANIRGGIMAHSYSSLGIQNMLLNGKPVGEIDVIAAMAGHFGTPVIMLSGDQAAVNPRSHRARDGLWTLNHRWQWRGKTSLSRSCRVSSRASRSGRLSFVPNWLRSEGLSEVLVLLVAWRPRTLCLLLRRAGRSRVNWAGSCLGSRTLSRSRTSSRQRTWSTSIVASGGRLF